MRYVFVVTVVFNGKVQYTWCYGNRDSAEKSYEEQKASYNRYGEVSKTKEETATFGVFSDSFDKEYTGKVLVKGYKTPDKFLVRLSGRKIL